MGCRRRTGGQAVPCGVEYSWSKSCDDRDRTHRVLCHRGRRRPAGFPARRAVIPDGTRRSHVPESGGRARCWPHSDIQSGPGLPYDLLSMYTGEPGRLPTCRRTGSGVAIVAVVQGARNIARYSAFERLELLFNVDIVVELPELRVERRIFHLDRGGCPGFVASNLAFHAIEFRRRIERSKGRNAFCHLLRCLGPSLPGNEAVALAQRGLVLRFQQLKHQLQLFNGMLLRSVLLVVERKILGGVVLSSKRLPGQVILARGDRAPRLFFPF